MAVYAYQSYLWNELARRLLLSAQARQAGLKPQDCLRVEDPFGEMVFPVARGIPEAWRDLDLPIPGKTTQPVEPWLHVAQQLLQEEKLITSDRSASGFRGLRIVGIHRPFFGEAPRKLFMEATEFVLSKPTHDPTDKRQGRMQRTVSFVLPRGGYATVVLRALGS